MIDEEKLKQHDIEYMANLRRKLEEIGVTEKRLRKLDSIPLTSEQVAYAVRSYIIGIEKREKARANKRVKATPLARRRNKSK